MTFRYSLTGEEALDGLKAVADPHRRLRMILLACFLILSGMLLAASIPVRQEGKIVYEVLSAVCAGMTILLLNNHAGHLRRAAKAASFQGNRYEVTIGDEGWIRTRNGTAVPIRQDRGSRLIETDMVYVIRPDRQHTFVIPKPAVKEAQKEKIFRICRENNCKIERRETG
jgi:hypothetical protein